jgi:hypothetical protein
MRKISGDIASILNQIFQKKGKNFILILQNWSKLVDAKFNNKTCPLHISYHMQKNEQIATLHISASSNVVSFELSFYKELLIDKINLLCGYKALHRINIKIID